MVVYDELSSRFYDDVELARRKEAVVRYRYPLTDQIEYVVFGFI